MHLKALGDWPESCQSDLQELAWPILEKFVLSMLGKGPGNTDKATITSDLSHLYTIIKTLIQKLAAKTRKSNALLDLILGEQQGVSESSQAKIRLAKYTIKHCGFSSSDEHEQK